MYEVEIIEWFSAAHRLRNYKGKCERLHGHNYKIHVKAAADQLGPEGMVIDFHELKSATRAALAPLDHGYLNDIKPFDQIEPSAENIAGHLFSEIQAGLGDARAALRSVSVWESHTSKATYYDKV